MPDNRHPISRIAARLVRLFHGDAGAGVLLILTAVAAMALANSPVGATYHDLFHHPLGWSPVAHLGTLHAWINDGLMAVFFFVVGLELKREFVSGVFRNRSAIAVPAFAATFGAVVPALIFFALTRGITLEGQSVSWESYLSMLIDKQEALNKAIQQAGSPFQKTKRGRF